MGPRLCVRSHHISTHPLIHLFPPSPDFTPVMPRQAGLNRGTGGCLSSRLAYGIGGPRVTAPWLPQLRVHRHSPGEFGAVLAVTRWNQGMFEWCAEL